MEIIEIVIGVVIALAFYEHSPIWGRKLKDAWIMAKKRRAQKRAK